MKKTSLFSLFTLPSLLFTDNELELIRQHISPLNGLNNTTSHAGELHLSGIVYVNADHWSIWVNNKRISSDNLHQIDGFQIEKVTPLMVEFSWIPPQSDKTQEFTLRPNQIFLVNKNRMMSK